MPSPSAFTHLSPQDGTPQMVDVGSKAVTVRTATAEACIRFPSEVAKALSEAGFQTAKGSILQTAVLAGTMAAKRTAELIPLCHLILLDRIAFESRFDEPTGCLYLTCTAKATHKTGVEMEALTGVSVAALTVYDMTKSFSHGILIQNTRLISKTGGASGNWLAEAHTTTTETPLLPQA